MNKDSGMWTHDRTNHGLRNRVRTRKGRSPHGNHQGVLVGHTYISICKHYFNGDIMAIKIAITGVHGSGKTTFISDLMIELAKRGKVCVVSEAARDCPFPINEDATYESQVWMFAEQLKRESEASVCDPDFIICDRSIMDSVVYASWGDSVNSGMLRAMSTMAREYMRTYDIVVRMPLNLEYLVDDGVRAVDLDFAYGINDLFDFYIDRHVTTKRTTVEGILYEIWEMTQ